MGYPEHLDSWQEECRSVRRPVTCGWAWVNSGLGVHRSSALRSSIVFDPAVQRLGGVLERVMDLIENRIRMRITRLATHLFVPRFPH
jgi:hypothetical protein